MGEEGMRTRRLTVWRIETSSKGISLWVFEVELFGGHKQTQSN